MNFCLVFRLMYCNVLQNARPDHFPTHCLYKELFDYLDRKLFNVAANEEDTVSMETESL